MYDLLEDLRSKCAKEKLTLRQVADELGVSFSALAKILRGETRLPSPHMDLAIQRFLGLKAPPCPCRRCTRKVQEGDALTKLRKEMKRLRRRVSHVELTQERLSRVLAERSQKCPRQSTTTCT